MKYQGMFIKYLIIQNTEMIKGNINFVIFFAHALEEMTFHKVKSQFITVNSIQNFKNNMHNCRFIFG